MRSRILSTKVLHQSQKELLLNAGFHVVEQNFISIEPLQFEISNVSENIIFTSSNAVKFIARPPESQFLRSKKTFCVGEKTAAFLKKEGFKVIERADYGIDLAKKIVTEYGNQHFTFFCGKKRRPELPLYLKKNAVHLKEIKVYDTKPTPKKVNSVFDGILFFSPSAVASYSSLNELNEAVAFCIGKTTAAEARKYTEKIVTATKPTVENVIVQVVKHFK